MDAATATSVRDAIVHFNKAPVDVVVVGATLGDTFAFDVMAELGARFVGVPFVAISPDASLIPALLERGAFDVLLDEETPRLGVTLLRAVRDAGLNRTLRSAYDELHGMLAASDRQASLLTNVPALLWTTDERLVLGCVDGAGATLDAVGRPVAEWDMHAPEEAVATLVDAHQRALAGETTTLDLVWLGQPRHITISPVLARSGRVSGTAAAALPSTALRNVPMLSDPLGESGARQVFAQRLRAALREAHGSGTRIGVFFVDVDRFTSVNELGGHAAGDAVLRTIAERLRALVGPQDAVVRFSADAFVIVCVDLSDPAQGDAISAAIAASFERPFAYGEHEFHLTASIGISFAPDDGDDAERMIANAEAALREAKRRGRNMTARYVPALIATPTDRHRLQRELSRAIERGQLNVLYQPIYDVQSGNVASAEALVRWRHPTLGLVVPDRFIPMAEESGLIDSISEWVITSVCRQIRAWTDIGIPDLHISVNVSARQLDRSDLLRFIQNTIVESGISPSSLEVEVTETSIMRDVYAARVLLRELQNMGVRIAIDDFGAGYTSLGFLRDLPIDDLKIDRDFVRDVARPGFGGAVVRAVVMLARELGVRTIAEGVEDNDQMEALRALRCDAVQGYLFSSPMSANEFASLLRQIA